MRGGGGAGGKIKAALQAHQFKNPESSLDVHIYRKLSNENLVAMDLPGRADNKMPETLINSSPIVNMWPEF